MSLPTAAVTTQNTSLELGKLQPQTGVERTGQVSDTGDITQFRAAMDSYRNTSKLESTSAAAPVGNKVSLGDKIMSRAGELAGEIKKDQAHVSKMLEQATRTGDSMSLMKAMLAMNDYQTRVQFVTKTISKATSSVDQLTKLQ